MTKKICKFLVAHNGSLTVLGMQDIDRLGMLSINRNSKNRQVAEESNKDKGKSQRQTRSDKWEHLKGELQEAETKNKQGAKDANPTVMRNNNKKSIASISEVLIKQYSITGAETKQNETTNDMQFNYDSIDFLAEPLIHNSPFITEEKEKDDMATIGMQCSSTDFLAEPLIHNSSIIIEEKEKHDMATIGMQFNSTDFLAESLIPHNSLIIEEETKDTAAQNTTTNNNNIESLIAGISTDVGKQAQTTQNKKRK